MSDQRVPVIGHVYVGRLPNGDAISHECDGTDCRLREQIEQMEREREGKNHATT